jgi:hypothetical protein
LGRMEVFMDDPRRRCRVAPKTGFRLIAAELSYRAA